MNVCVAEFKDVGGLTMRHDNDSITIRLAIGMTLRKVTSHSY